MNKNKIDLIRQALGAAESSIKLAKQLLSEVEGGGISPSKQKAQELPGISGIFDGENMVSEAGEPFPVPANYASKSMLVVGDTLKLVEEGKEKRFKQIEHVKRHKTMGILAKKDGKWRAVTPEGSYKVLPAAVSHFGADVGSEVVLHLPAGNLTVPYGAIESVKKPTEGKAENVEEPNVEVKEEASKDHEEKKTEAKPKEEKANPSVDGKEEKKAAPKGETKKEEPKAKPAPEVKKVEEPKKAEPARQASQGAAGGEVKKVEAPTPAPKPEVPAAKPTAVAKPVEAPVPEKAPAVPAAPVLEKKVEPAPASAPAPVTEEDELT